jgi:hypothetical protein
MRESVFKPQAIAAAAANPPRDEQLGGRKHGRMVLPRQC